MINPDNITDFNQSPEALQEKLLFWIFAAGHNAHSTAQGLNRFLYKIDQHILGLSPRLIDKSIFYKTHLISDHDTFAPIVEMLSKSGLGCWKQKSKAIYELQQPFSIGYTLDKASLEDLEKISYVGMKTARGFLLHSRADVQVAVIDTHILKWFKSLGYDVPKQTPTKKKYLELEKIFLEKCKIYNISPYDMDLDIWLSYRRAPKSNL